MGISSVTPIPAPRAVGRVRPVPPADDCRIDGPCGVCATLSPAARAALAEELASGADTRAALAGAGVL